MIINELNAKAYEFVEKVRLFKRVPQKNDSMGSIDHVVAKDLAECEIINTPSFERVQDNYDKDIHIVLLLNDKIFGFEKSVYPKFFSLIDEILNLSDLGFAVTYKFIEEKVLIWIVDVYQNKRSLADLITFLRSEIEKATEERVYYFPILNLHINKPFKIGNVVITFLTKQFFDELWDKYKYKEKYTAEEFDKNLRKFQGHVFASVKVKAEYEKGNLFALEKCSLAVDVLKMYSSMVSLATRNCLIDIEERINVNYQSNSLSHIVDNPQKLKVSTTIKADPIFINDDTLDFFKQKRIDILSTFLVNYNNENELQRLLIQAIRLFSIAISSADIHFRIAQLVTISESLLLENDLKYNLEKKCKQRFVDILYHQANKNGKEFYDKLTELYQVRHKIMHKAIRLNISNSNLAEFQNSLLDLILKLILNSYETKSKSEMIRLIDEGMEEKQTLS